MGSYEGGGNGLCRIRPQAAFYLLIGVVTIERKTGIWEDKSPAFPELVRGTEAERQAHRAALEYSLYNAIVIRDRSDIQSTKHWSELVEPFEHQVQNLITFSRIAPVGLIADEVGLGKTVSAGLIISELRTRRAINRVLVVCPKILMPQWQSELAEKFGIPADYESGQAILRVLKGASPVVITNYHTARDHMSAIREAGFNMVVLDEAHKLKSLHGSPKPARMATVMADALRDRAFRYVLMLTATPIQNSAWDLYSLIDLLTTAKRHKNPLGTPDEFRERYVTRIGNSSHYQLKPSMREPFRAAIRQYIVRASRRNTKLPFPSRRVTNRRARSISTSAESEILLREALSGQRPLQQISLAEAMMSSNAAFAAQVRNAYDNRKSFSSDLVKRVENLAKREPLGAKFAVLRELIAELRNENPNFRLVVFTRRLATQDALMSALRQQGVKVGSIRGGDPGGNRQTIKDFWKNSPEVNVVVSTEAGAEGVNLQVANVLVNYDLPWNPMVLEQRIGRVQRLGSEFKTVQIVNLVVAGSIEERIVARLLRKLMDVSSALGDLEPILEAARLDSEEKPLSEQIRKLVVDALEKKDTEKALREIESSIEKGKQLYEQEEALVEETLGEGLDELHHSGPKSPALEQVIPSVEPREFVKLAYTAGGAKVEELPDGSLRIREPGSSTFWAVFDPSDRRLANVGAFGGTQSARVRLFEPGSPAFEKLVGKWESNNMHNAIALRSATDERALALVEDWLKATDPGIAVTGSEVVGRQESFHGKMLIKASANVLHDQVDRLVQLDVGEPLPNELAIEAEQSDRAHVPQKLALGKNGAVSKIQVKQAVEGHSDIIKFQAFYFDKLEEELTKSSSVRSSTRQDFTPVLAASVRAAEGYFVDTIDLTVRFSVDGEQDVEAEFKVTPLRVLEAPETDTCSLTSRTVPAAALESCDITRRRALAHLLVRSERSNRKALPDRAGTCEVTGAVLLEDELGICSGSRQRVDLEMLAACDISGDLFLPEFLDVCELTGKTVESSKLILSDVSGKRFRSDQSATCAVTNRVGHVSEFGRCQETRAYVSHEHLGTCAVSGMSVRTDLLVGSEKTPGAFALRRNTRTCEASGKRMLKTEGEESSVSGKWVDPDLLVPSDGGGGKALPDEMVICEVSGIRLLPAETAVCSATQKRVQTTLLQQNDVTGQTMLSSLMQVCPETGARGRPEDLERCEVTGYLVNPEVLATCSQTNQRALKRLMVECGGCGKLLLESVSARTSDGEAGHDLCMVNCPWTGKDVFEKDSKTCAFSGLTFASSLFASNSTVAAPLQDARTLAQNSAGTHNEPDVVELCRAAGLKPHKVWAVHSYDTGLVALCFTERRFLGFGQRIKLCFVDRIDRAVVGNLVEG